MIIVRLMGGLGNQLFQYAAGRSLSLRTKQILAFDLGFLDNTPDGQTKRELELENFGIPVLAAPEGEIARLVGPIEQAGLQGRIKRRLNRLIRPDVDKVIQDDGPRSIERLKGISDEAYLIGFWQTERTFEDIADIIHGDLALRSSGSQADRETLELIRNTNSVSIHIRRGDYVSDSRTYVYHGICTVEYYKAATELMAKRVGSPSFFVFSDDQAWCKENLSFGFPMEFVESRDSNRTVGDLRLMSNCKHNIIANSSYSWWGAWINENPGKIVIAPRKWFNHANSMDSELIPNGWLRI